MTDNRHPAGTSLGGRWAPGSAAEVEMPVRDDPSVLDANVDEILDDVDDDAAAMDARDVLQGYYIAPGSDLHLAREKLHEAADAGLTPRVESEVNDALTRLYAAEYPDDTTGIGRLVGDNDACRVAEAEMRASGAGLRPASDDDLGFVLGTAKSGGTFFAVSESGATAYEVERRAGGRVPVARSYENF